MMIALWVLLPCAAIPSCIAGHIWRYRHDGFRAFPYGVHGDRAHNFGAWAFRVGVPLLFAARITEVLAAGPHSRPEGAIRVIVIALQLVAIPLAVVGASLIMVPTLITGDNRALVSPLDRITLPVIVAALVTSMLVTFDPTSTNDRYRTAETLFTWVRSLVALHPDPVVMVHAPLIYQARGISVMILIAIWPYTRLAGIFATPLLHTLPRLTLAARRTFGMPLPRPQR